jgi:hypothetical protein
MYVARFRIFNSCSDMKLGQSDTEFLALWRDNYHEFTVFCIFQINEGIIRVMSVLIVIKSLLRNLFINGFFSKKIYNCWTIQYTEINTTEVD